MWKESCFYNYEQNQEELEEVPFLGAGLEDSEKSLSSPWLPNKPPEDESPGLEASCQVK